MKEHTRKEDMSTPAPQRPLTLETCAQEARARIIRPTHMISVPRNICVEEKDLPAKGEFIRVVSAYALAMQTNRNEMVQHAVNLDRGGEFGYSSGTSFIGLSDIPGIVVSNSTQYINDVYKALLKKTEKTGSTPDALVSSLITRMEVLGFSGKRGELPGAASWIYEFTEKSKHHCVWIGMYRSVPHALLADGSLLPLHTEEEVEKVFGPHKYGDYALKYNIYGSLEACLRWHGGTSCMTFESSISTHDLDDRLGGED